MRGNTSKRCFSDVDKLMLDNQIGYDLYCVDIAYTLIDYFDPKKEY